MTALYKDRSVVGDQARPHVVIMEDDLGVAKGLETTLSKEGYDVYLADTGARALAAFKEKRYNLIVADLDLPDMDGMEVIRKIKTDTPDTEVVVITGLATVAKALEAMKLGARDFLPKPFNEAQIKAAIGAALKKRVEGGGDPVGPEIEAAGRIQKRQVIQVLNRTAEDETFRRDLMEKGPVALEDYDLSSEAKAAVASGDLKWINENVGELTQKELMFIYDRLGGQAW